jgi:hypothetical protein
MNLNPKIAERLHKFADAIGVKPAVVDGFFTTIVLLGANTIATGDPLDLNAVKLAGLLFILAVVGVAAPPAQGVTQEVVIAAKPELQAVTDIVDPSTPTAADPGSVELNIARRIE